MESDDNIEFWYNKMLITINGHESVAQETINFAVKSLLWINVPLNKLLITCKFLLKFDYLALYLKNADRKNDGL